MEEPCDWDVCSDASAPLKWKQKKENRAASSALDEEVELKRPRGHRAARLEPPREDNTRTVSQATDVVTLRSQKAAPSSTELQEALPKIPPLSSFKSCTSRFVSFEEAEQDFHTFITTGLGRSVEVIREFRGQEDASDGSAHRESVLLEDEEPQKWKFWQENQHRVTQHQENPHQENPHRENLHQENHGRSEIRGADDSAVEASTYKPKMSSSKSEAQRPSAARRSRQVTCETRGETPWSQPENRGSEKNIRGGRQTAPGRGVRDKPRALGEDRQRPSQKTRKERKRESDGDEEGEWSADTYWSSCFRAWNHEDMSSSEDHSFYSSWMAAYYINMVYMEEMLRATED